MPVLCTLHGGCEGGCAGACERVEHVRVCAVCQVLGGMFAEHLRSCTACRGIGTPNSIAMHAPGGLPTTHMLCVGTCRAYACTTHAPPPPNPQHKHTHAYTHHSPAHHPLPQVFKVFVLGRVTLKSFHSLPGLVDERIMEAARAISTEPNPSLGAWGFACGR